MKDAAVYKFCNSFRVSSHGVNEIQRNRDQNSLKTASTTLLKVKTASVLPHLLAEKLQSAAEKLFYNEAFFEIYL